MSTAVGIGVGLVTLIGSVGAVYTTVATKTEVQAVKIELQEEQRSVAGAQTQMHKLDFYDNRLELIEREVLYLEEKEEVEGLTPSEERRLERLLDDLEFYEQREEETRTELMKAG